MKRLKVMFWSGLLAALLGFVLILVMDNIWFARILMFGGESLLTIVIFYKFGFVRGESKLKQPGTVATILFVTVCLILSLLLITGRVHL